MDNRFCPYFLNLFSTSNWTSKHVFGLVSNMHRCMLGRQQFVAVASNACLSVLDTEPNMQ